MSYTNNGKDVRNSGEKLFVVISGPSGAGKDSVVRGLLDKDVGLEFVVTTNSRPKRPAEKEGIDYYFVTKQEFELMVERNEFIEHAVVYGDYKGVTKKSVDKALSTGLDILIRVDVQGAATLKNLYNNVLLIYIKPDAEDQLLGQLKARKTESMETIQNRIGASKQEQLQTKQFDYIVTNKANDLSRTIDRIESIIKKEIG